MTVIGLAFRATQLARMMGSERPRQIDPTGKSIPVFRICVKPKIQKYFCFHEIQIMAYQWPSRPTQRASAVVTDVGRVAVDADVAIDDRDKGVRQKRVVLTPGNWRQAPKKLALPRSDGGNRVSAHRGERAISRKAIAQGMSDVLRCPVCSCAAFLALFAHEIAGAARIRHSLRPLISRAKNTCKTSGATRRGIAKSRSLLSEI